MKKATLREQLEALRAAGYDEVVIKPDGTVKGRRRPPVKAVDPQTVPPPFIPTVPGEPLPAQPWIVPQLYRIKEREPCMFDGLPPGVYGLVCSCPRCSPRMMVTMNVVSYGAYQDPIVRTPSCWLAQ
jgi:hypothetical protein